MLEKEGGSQSVEDSISSCPIVRSQIAFDWHQQTNPHKGTLQFTPTSYSMNIFVNYVRFKIFLKCIAYISSFLNYVQNAQFKFLLMTQG